VKKKIEEFLKETGVPDANRVQKIVVNNLYQLLKEVVDEDLKIAKKELNGEVNWTRRCEDICPGWMFFSDILYSLVKKDFESTMEAYLVALAKKGFSFRAEHKITEQFQKRAAIQEKNSKEAFDWAKAFPTSHWTMKTFGRVSNLHVGPTPISLPLVGGSDEEHTIRTYNLYIKTADKLVKIRPSTWKEEQVRKATKVLFARMPIDYLSDWTSINPFLNSRDRQSFIDFPKDIKDAYYFSFDQNNNLVAAKEITVEEKDLSSGTSLSEFEYINTVSISPEEIDGIEFENDHWVETTSVHRTLFKKTKALPT